MPTMSLTLLFMAIADLGRLDRPDRVDSLLGLMGDLEALVDNTDVGVDSRLSMITQAERSIHPRAGRRDTPREALEQLKGTLARVKAQQKGATAGGARAD